MGSTGLARQSHPFADISFESWDVNDAPFPTASLRCEHLKRRKEVSIRQSRASNMGIAHRQMAVKHIVDRDA